ncbi:MAG: protein kinase [bacterium]
MIGKTVLHYRVIDKLGEGGMGVVYKAEDTKLKRTVALKFLPRGLDAHEPERARFLQEAQAASALNHPHVCTIHDICETEGQQFIVMEYVDGVTLLSRIAQQPIKLNDALAYAIQTGEALQEAHASGIVHRDIKPANIMINARNQIKVMDFGLAKLKGSLKLTRTSSTVGTLAYMAPEQIEGGEVDARSDIFSFGVVLYEMLTGRRPFGGETEAAVMHSILGAEPEPLQKHLPESTSEVVHILNRALEKDPEDRYQTVHDMLIDLRRAKKETSRVSRGMLATRTAEQPLPTALAGEQPPPGAPGTTSVAGPEVRKPRMPRRRALWVALAVASAAVAAVLVSGPLISSRRVPTLNPAMAIRTLEVPFTTIGTPGLSRDGNWVVFAAWDAEDKGAIYFMNVAKGAPTRLTPEIADLNLADISPDNSEVVYDNLAEGSQRGVYVIPSSGGTGRRIAESGANPYWRPDGQRIGYIRLGDAWVPSSTGKREFWTVKPDGSDNRLEFVDSLTNTRQYWWSYAWSPDGRSVAWLRALPGHSEIIIHDLGSGQERQLTSFGKPIDFLAWGSNGQVFFASSKGGNTNIWMMPAEGGEAIQVTRGSGPDMAVSVSADCRRLIYLESRRISNIWIADIDGRNARQLTFGNQWMSRASFAPDNRIAFEITSDDTYRPGSQIFTIRDDGSERTQVTTGSGWHSYPGWSRDGKYLCYASRGIYEPSESSRVYITESSNPGTPKLIGRGISASWLDEETLILIEAGSMRSVQYSIRSPQPVSVGRDSVLERPLPDGKYTLIRDLRRSAGGWWLREEGEPQGRAPRLLLPAEYVTSANAASSLRYVLYMEPNGDLWRMSIPEGRRGRLPDLFKNLNPAYGLIRTSRDDKQAIYLKQRSDCRLLVIDNLFK